MDLLFFAPKELFERIIMTLRSLREKFPTQYDNVPVIEPYSIVLECSDEREPGLDVDFLNYLYPHLPELTPEEKEEEIATAQTLIKQAYRRNIDVSFADLGVELPEADPYAPEQQAPTYPEGTIGHRISAVAASIIFSSVLK